MTASIRGYRILTVTAILFFVAASTLIFSYVVDDTYISLLYARNLAMYGELVANVGERCLGFTNFLFVIIEAGLIKTFQSIYTGYDAVIPVKLFLLVCAGLCLYLPWRFTSLRDDPVAGAFWFISLGTAAPFIIWTAGGMETVFLALLLVVAALAFLGIQGSSSDTSQYEIVMLLFLGAAALTRLDSVLISFPLIVAAGLKYGWRSRQWWTRLLLFFVLPIAAMELFNYLYYGALLPGSFHSKGFKAGRSIFTFGIVHFLELLFLVNMNIIHLVIIIKGIRKARINSHDRDNKAANELNSCLVILAGIALYSLYIISQGYVHMMFAYRFNTPILPLFYMASALSIKVILENKLSPLPFRRLGLGLLSCLLAINIASFGYAYKYDMLFSFLPLERQHTNMSIKGYTKMMTHFKNAGEAIYEHFPRNTKMYCWSGGIIPYIADVYAFDDLLIATRATTVLNLSKDNIFDSFDIIVSPYEAVRDDSFEVWRKFPSVMHKGTASYNDSTGPHYIYVSTRIKSVFTKNNIK